MTGLSPFISLKNAVRRFIQDRCIIEARSLSFLTILALVPLSVIVLFQLKNLFFYPLLQESFMSILSDYFLPERASEISTYFDSMLEKTRSLGVVGVLASLLIVLGLLSSLSRTVNRIWRKDRRSNLLRYSIKLVVMLLTIPALVIFTSLLLYSNELISIHLPGYLQFIQRIRLFQFVSLVLHWLLTALLLGLLPHEQVRVSYTFIAAIFSGSCWYLLRLGLNVYVRWFPQLPLLYGSLTFIPVFLLWVFLSWLVILFGVELNYTLHYDDTGKL